jgi:hypothetical protein
MTGNKRYIYIYTLCSSSPQATRQGSARTEEWDTSTSTTLRAATSWCTRPPRPPGGTCAAQWCWTTTSWSPRSRNATRYSPYPGGQSSSRRLDVRAILRSLNGEPCAWSVLLQAEQPLRQAVVPAEHVEAAGAGLQVQRGAGDVRRLRTVAQRPGPPAGVPPVNCDGVPPPVNAPVGLRPEPAVSSVFFFNNSTSCHGVPRAYCYCQGVIAHGLYGYMNKMSHSSFALPFFWGFVVRASVRCVCLCLPGALSVVMGKNPLGITCTNLYPRRKIRQLKNPYS